MIPPFLQGMFNAIFQCLDGAGVPWNVALAVAGAIVSAIAIAVMAVWEADHADGSH